MCAGVGPTPFTLQLPFNKTAMGRLAVDDRLRVMAPPAVDGNGRVRAADDAAPGPKEMCDVSMLQEEDANEKEQQQQQLLLAEPVEAVWALGDCCANADQPLPALAQVAEQQGKWLAKVLNAKARGEPVEGAPPFVYRPLGAMAAVGESSACVACLFTQWMLPIHILACFARGPAGWLFSLSAGGRSAVIELQRRNGRFSWSGFVSWLAWRSAYLTRLGTVKARLYVATNWTLTLLFGRDISRW